MSPAVVSPAVVLVGPPGAEVAQAGAALARLLALPLRDTDADVERAAGVSVAELFVDRGEAAFRELERVAVLAALAEHDGVLVLGTGAVTDPMVEAALAGHVVAFLDVNVTFAARRIGFNAPTHVANPRASWLRLMEQRRPVYARVAGVTVLTDDRSPEQVAGELAAVLASR